jgi:nucleoside-diphosphate kinase
MERTLCIIKPDAVKKKVQGHIIQKILDTGFKILGMKMLHLTEEQAKTFYAVHKERPFYKDLVEFMLTGPVMVQVLEGENAINVNRDLMGATDPKQAKEGTLRRRFASNVERNVVHGSDAPETAAFEIKYFFNALEIFQY